VEAAPFAAEEVGTRELLAVKTAWYRTVVGWKRQRSSDVVLIVLIGLAGGVALGSLAAARRTASSFSTFLAASNPSDLAFEPGRRWAERHCVDPCAIPH
jgi:hypothetical protein